MDCWEFLNQKDRWHWRCLNRDGTVHDHSRSSFNSLLAAFVDAQRHGLVDGKHHWYLVRAGREPRAERLPLQPQAGNPA